MKCAHAGGKAAGRRTRRSAAPEDGSRRLLSWHRQLLNYQLSSAQLSSCLPPTRRLCLLQYEKEVFTPTAFMELFNKLNATLSDEQLSVFAGEP